MGFLRKVFRKLGKGIKKVGKVLGRAFGNVFGAFGKLGPIGMFGLWMMMPTLASGWTNMLGRISDWGGSFATANTNKALQAVGEAVKHSANIVQAGSEGIGFVSKTITGGIKTTLDYISGPLDIGTGVETWLNKQRAKLKLTESGIKPLKPGQTRTSSALKYDANLAKSTVYEGSGKEVAKEAAKKVGEKLAEDGLQGWKKTARDAAIGGTISTAFQVGTAKYLAPEDEGGGGLVMGQLASEPSGFSHNAMTDIIYQGYQNAGYSGQANLDAMSNSSFYGTGSPEWLSFLQQQVPLPQRTV